MKTLKSIAIALFCLAAVCTIGLVSLDFRQSIDKPITYDLYQCVNINTNQSEFVMIDSLSNHYLATDTVNVNNITGAVDDKPHNNTDYYKYFHQDILGRHWAIVEATNGVILNVKQDLIQEDL